MDYVNLVIILKHNGCVPDAKPASNLPAMIMGTFCAQAIRDHPRTLGTTAILIVFNLPMLSIKKPPVMAPMGTTITMTLAEEQNIQVRSKFDFIYC